MPTNANTAKKCVCQCFVFWRHPSWLPPPLLNTLSPSFLFLPLHSIPLSHALPVKLSFLSFLNYKTNDSVFAWGYLNIRHPTSVRQLDERPSNLPPHVTCGGR